MFKKYLLTSLLFLSASSLVFAGGLSGGGGVITKKLEILDWLSKNDPINGGIFIADDQFIELIGIFGLKDVSELEKSGITINQLIVKNGVSGIQGYNATTDYSFVIFSDSQKPLIKDIKSLVNDLQNSNSGSFLVNNN